MSAKDSGRVKTCGVLRVSLIDLANTFLSAIRIMMRYKFPYLGIRRLHRQSELDCFRLRNSPDEQGTMYLDLDVHFE
jgi:hypothetical protein